MDYEMSEICEIDHKPTTSHEIVDPNNQRKKSGNLNLRLYFAVFIANLLSFSTGTSAAWSSTVITTLRSDKSPFGRPATILEESWITALVNISAITGPLFASYLSHKFGRKKTLLLFAIPTFMSHLIIAFATTPMAFYIARFMMGFGTGCTYTVNPMYIGEIAETKNRGSLGCFMSVMLCCGMLMVYVVGPIVSLMTFSFILMVPLAIFLVIFGLFVPESPYHYMSNQNIKAAEKSLRKLRTNTSIAEELAGINKVVEESKNVHTVNQILKSRSFRKGIIITTLISGFQQFVGVSAIVSYMELIFAASKSSMSPYTSTILVALIQAMFTVVPSILVDRVGRRFLIIMSCTGLAVSLIPMGVFFYMKHAEMDVSVFWWLPVASLILYMIAFCSGMGPLPAVLLGELFSSESKALASSITASTCLVCAFLTTLSFPILELLIGLHGLFWLFAANAIYCLLFVAWYVPETKGKSFLEILRILEQ